MSKMPGLILFYQGIGVIVGLVLFAAILFYTVRYFKQEPSTGWKIVLVLFPWGTIIYFLFRRHK
jgi:hypothetical protein